MSRKTDIEDYCQKTLACLKQHQLPATPEHYAVWYHYVIGFPKIKTIIDRALADHTSITNNFSRALYHQYLEQPATGDIHTLLQMKTMLSNMLSAFSEFSGEHINYKKRMDAHITDLHHYSKPDDLQAVVKDILETTEALQLQGAMTARQFEATKAETETLRSHLAQATREAQQDFLTGLLNRKALDMILGDLLKVAEKQRAPLTLLMIDIDHFKAFNDKHGHLIGDEVLKTVANVLKECLKGRDIIVRFGGEEFAVLLPNTAIEGGMVVAEGIRKNIASKELRRKDLDEVIGQISVSIGVAEYRGGREDEETFIGRADQALYNAKNSGRNQVLRAS